MTARILPNGDVLFPGVEVHDIPDDQPSTLAESGVPFAFEFDTGPYVEHDYSLTLEEEAELEAAMEAEGGFRISELEELERETARMKGMH